jgi:hypothetical protein
MLAAAAAAFFLLRATQKDGEKSEWEDYKEPQKDPTPTPDAKTTETFSFDQLRSNPVELRDIQGDGESITITGVPFDEYTFEISYPLGIGTVMESFLGDASRYMGLKTHKADKKLLAIAKNVGTVRQLLKDNNTANANVVLSAKRIGAVFGEPSYQLVTFQYISG